MPSYQITARLSTFRGLKDYWRVPLFLAIICCSEMSLSGNDLNAIPAFARKYKQSCTTCHMGFPALNPFGKAFRYNGYRFPEETPEEIAEEPVKLGLKAQKILFPRKGVYPGEIPGTIPVAIRVEMDMRTWDHGPIRSEFRFPHEIYLLSGGNFGERFSFFIEWPVYKDGSLGELSRTFLQYNKLLNGKPSLNLKVGLFETAAVPFTKRRRLTMDHYVVSDITFGDVPFRLKDSQKGLEAWGVLDGKRGGGLYYGAGIVNGTPDSDHKSGSFADDDSDKDVYARFFYKWGGLQLTGRGGPVPQGGNWHENSLRIGTLIYRGFSNGTGFTRMGWDIRYQQNDFILFSALLLALNDDETADLWSRRAYFLESNYYILPWVIGALRYEGYRDLGMSEEGRAVISHVSFYLRPNLAMRFEGVNDLSPANQFVFSVRFDNGF